MKLSVARHAGHVTRRPVVWSAWGIAIALHIGALGVLSIIDWPPAPGQSSRSVTFDVTLTQAPSTASQHESANAVAAPETPAPARQPAQSAISAKAPMAREVQPSLKNEASSPKAQQREEAKPERLVDRVTKPAPSQQANATPQTQKSERSAASSRAEKGEKKAAPSASDLLAQATSHARSSTFGMQPENDTRAPVNGAQRAAINRYIKSWTNSVERYGNQFHNAPSHLQGTLRIRAVILRSGELASVEVIQSSGYPELDQTALTTVREAAPYRPFDSGMGDRQRLVIMRTWQFGQGNSFGVQ